MSKKPDLTELPIGVKSVNITEQKVFDGLPFPLILSPSDDFQDKDAQFWNDWVKENLKVIESLLFKYGAILFRGLALDTAKDFDEFCKAYGYQEFPYLGGFAQRKHVIGSVHTSSESPHGALIPLHHELVYVNDYPLILFFYCDIPAKEGGETPIALSNVIYRKMLDREPDFVKRLEKDGLRYLRIAPDGDNVNLSYGKGWQSTFLSSNKEEAKRNANDLGYDIEWLEDGSMKTVTEVLPAIRVDKRTGKKMWFNAVYMAYLTLNDPRYDRTKAVTFPNGDTVSAETIETLRQVMDEANVSFTWQRKDVVMIDNRTVQHARSDFFVPPRRILASQFKDHQGPL